MRKGWVDILEWNRFPWDFLEWEKLFKLHEEENWDLVKISMNNLIKIPIGRSTKFKDRLLIWKWATNENVFNRFLHKVESKQFNQLRQINFSISPVKSLVKETYWSVRMKEKELIEHRSLLRFPRESIWLSRKKNFEFFSSTSYSKVIKSNRNEFSVHFSCRILIKEKILSRKSSLYFKRKNIENILYRRTTDEQEFIWHFEFRIIFLIWHIKCDWIDFC